MTTYDPYARVSRALGALWRDPGPGVRRPSARPSDRLSDVNVDRVLQRGLVAAYLIASGAGVAAAFYTPPSMVDTIGDVGANTWGLFLLVGGMVCLAGVLVPRGAKGDWFGEFTGLWLVIAAVGVYSGVALSTVGADPGRGAGALLLAALDALLVVRWFRVRDDKRKALVRDGASLPKPPTPAP